MSIVDLIYAYNLYILHPNATKLLCKNVQNGIDISFFLTFEKFIPLRDIGGANSQLFAVIPEELSVRSL